MLEGYRTYITLAVMALYNVVLPLIGVTEVSSESLSITINTILIIFAGIFRKLAKK